MLLNGKLPLATKRANKNHLVTTLAFVLSAVALLYHISSSYLRESFTAISFFLSVKQQKEKNSLDSAGFSLTEQPKKPRKILCFLSNFQNKMQKLIEKLL